MEQPSSSNQNGGKRFEVIKWDAVAKWCWDLAVDCCAICRNNIMEPCIECQANNILSSGEECTIASGVCHHVYHLHCISRWLKTRNVCPLDNSQWSYLQFGK